MAAVHPQTTSIGPDTPITVKVLIDGTNRRFKLALRDLGAHTLPQKLRSSLAISPECDIKFERFSDSAGTYIALDSNNPAVYKQLYRAAKAKLKLRLKATVIRPVTAEAAVERPSETQSFTVEENRILGSPARQNTYLETVLSHLPPDVDPVSSFKSTNPPSCTYPISCDMPNPVANHQGAGDLSRPTLPTLNDFAYGTFSIDCNYCGKSVPNEHYHCGICENGDFDLCQTCISAGISCQGVDHWLIKRSIKNGRVIPSVTETLPPKSARKQDTVSRSISEPAHEEEERTCNSCISRKWTSTNRDRNLCKTELPSSSFVTCNDCPDFDLCFSCFETGEHGHHPAHTFLGSNIVSTGIRRLLGAGRGFVHEAYCDGCDKQIIGVRYKCLTCPDFDYCANCHQSPSKEHIGHRFAPLYEQLLAAPGHFRKEIHRGVYCDGPICLSRTHKQWIRGDRYKCAVCVDTDFCADCEAHPQLLHNQTHPLIKIKIPIRNVIVEAIHEPEFPAQPVQLGDRPQAKNASTETVQPASINVATQVQTMAEVKPVEAKPVITDVPQISDVTAPEVAAPMDLQAWFESDSTADGTTFEPNHHVSQSWTLRNPGPQAWPAGCAVHFIGGDDMRNLDMKHPSSVSSLTAANQSNTLEEPLEPGKTAVFTVLLKSPLREGRAISYWRLKTSEGYAFGHKLWVDITVASKSVEVVESKAAQPAPVPELFKMQPVAESLEGSSMIFPKLEKESPESSVHEIAKASSVSTVTETIAAAEEDELVDDLESLGLEDEEETDDGFLTDEEYDILDADDEEFLEEAQRAVANQK